MTKVVKVSSDLQELALTAMCRAEGKTLVHFTSCSYIFLLVEP